MAIKGKQEKQKRALLHTWQRRALLRWLGSVTGKNKKNSEDVSRNKQTYT